MQALPASSRVRSVALTVNDLEQVAEFYQTVLGLDTIEASGSQVALGVGHEEIVRLIGDPDAERPPLRAGLFHLAILVPSRKDLAEALVRLLGKEHRLGGASDHGVSEALYLTDPEGNGVEIYRDRPREEWPRNGEFLAMVTEPLDLAALVAEGSQRPPKRMPDGTRLGHVHLHCTDIASSNDHYVEWVGFGLMQRYGTDASFFGAGGYHHHVAVNTWGPPRRMAEPGQLGLRWFDLEVPDTETQDRILGSPPGKREMEGDAPVLVDPSGNSMRVVVAG